MHHERIGMSRRIISSGNPYRISWFKFTSFQLQGSPNHARFGLHCISPNTFCFSSKKGKLYIHYIVAQTQPKRDCSQYAWSLEMNFITGKSTYQTWAMAAFVLDSFASHSIFSNLTKLMYEIRISCYLLQYWAPKSTLWVLISRSFLLTFSGFLFRHL